MAYLYEEAGDERFQKLCQTLLAHVHPDVQCLPVGQRDGGTDARRRGPQGSTIVYQVKWTRDRRNHPDPVVWLLQTVKSEHANIERLVAEGASEYLLLTSVPGTAHQKAGTVARLNRELDRLGASYGVPMSCWWRDDLDRRMDTAPESLLWAYPELLTGVQAVRALLGGAAETDRLRRQQALVRAVVAAQWEDDLNVKFRQVGLDAHLLTDLFVDVPSQVSALPGTPGGPLLRRKPSGPYEAEGGATRLTRDLADTVVLGAPGQGKSTLVQYLCQAHRAVLLGRDPAAAGFPPEHVPGSARLAIKVDLADFADWLHGGDAAGSRATGGTANRGRTRAGASLERFLTEVLAHAAGDDDVTLDDLNDLLCRYPTLLVMDGLDEVGRTDLRGRVVDHLHKAAARLRERGADLVVLVTSRPIEADLPAPNPQQFRSMVLLDMPERLRHRYLRRWARAYGLGGPATRELQDVYERHGQEAHVRELATNPMQLSILLHLMRTKGFSIPAQRTALYGSYMDLFLERESLKDPVVLEHRELLERVTAHLGWHLQARAEDDGSSGRASLAALKQEMRHYLIDGSHDTALVDALFTAVRDRVWVLTSKVQGTFEFDVQPVREFFAARHLADTAPSNSADGTKAHRLRETLRRPYWDNTARFLAGSFSSGEQAGLGDTLQDLIDEGVHRPFRPRRLARTLLGDGTLRRAPRTQQRLVSATLDKIGVRLFYSETVTGGRSLPPRHGGDDARALLGAALRDDPDGPLAHEQAVLLRAHGGPAELRSWWEDALRSRPDRHAALLQTGAALGVLNGAPESELRTLAGLPGADAALLAGGARPPAGGALETQLLRAVADGRCSHVGGPGTSTADALLAVAGPARLLRQLPRQPTDAGPPPDELEAHGLAAAPLLDNRQSAALRRLRDTDAYRALAAAARQHKGQTGTTGMWTQTALELHRAHPGSWLPREIAVVAASCPLLVTGGTVTPGGTAFSEDWDPGTLVQQTRVHAQDTAWWRTRLEHLGTALELSAYTLALVAQAHPDIVLGLLPTVDTLLTELDGSDRRRLLEASARIGWHRTARNVDLAPALPAPLAGLSPTGYLLLTHQATPGQVPWDLVSPATRTAAAALGPAAFRLLRAAWTRTAPGPAGEDGPAAADALDVLRAAGPRAALPGAGIGSKVTAGTAERVLAEPDTYPLRAVIAAEAHHALPRVRSLLQEAAARDWFVQH